MMPYQLVYSSAPTKKMMKSHLYMILRQSRINNKLNNVTGLLIFVDDLFFQVLEGEEITVKNIFERIKKDKRHQNINILFEGNVKERAFPKWEMAYASPSSKEIAAWAGLHNTTTIQEIILNMGKKPDLFPKIFVELLADIEKSDQELNDTP